MTPTSGGSLPHLVARGGRRRCLYQLIADDLREQIRSGQFKPGEQIPSMRFLRDYHQVADMTVRSAVRVLEEEGLAHTMQGKWSFVADPLPATTPDQDRADTTAPGRVMPSVEFLELSRRIEELAAGQARLLEMLSAAGTP
ncbi:GntR family transcriptional regulator [Streptomyces sp. NPDC096193]|uniref:GntR family transcriptional regulator n=1 Tax=Streptomyces sp. NPDC096193 TaxID=3155821 RepID=UPI0033264610